MTEQAFRIIHEPNLPAPILLFEPRGKCHAQLFFFHGICEHGLRYTKLAKELAKNGIRVIISDHQGHGLSHKDCQENVAQIAETFELSSAQQKIQLGHTQRSLQWKISPDKVLETFSKISVTHHLKDMKHLVETAFEKKYFDKKIPFYIAGQSMGGLLTTALGKVLHETPFKAKAAILLSPAFAPQPSPNKLTNLAEQIFLKLSWRSHDEKSWLKKPFQKISQKPLKVSTAWACKHISDIDAEEKVFSDDFLIADSCTLNYLSSIEKLMFETHKNAFKYPLPIQIFYSKQDRIVNSKGTDTFLKNYLSTHDQASLQINRYDEIPAHDLLRSTPQNEIIQKIVDYTKA